MIKSWVEEIQKHSWFMIYDYEFYLSKYGAVLIRLHLNYLNLTISKFYLQ